MPSCCTLCIFLNLLVVSRNRTVGSTRVQRGWGKGREGERLGNTHMHGKVGGKRRGRERRGREIESEKLACVIRRLAGSKPSEESGQTRNQESRWGSLPV